MSRGFRVSSSEPEYEEAYQPQPAFFQHQTSTTVVGSTPAGYPPSGYPAAGYPASGYGAPTTGYGGYNPQPGYGQPNPALGGAYNQHSAFHSVPPSQLAMSAHDRSVNAALKTYDVNFLGQNRNADKIEVLTAALNNPTLTDEEFLAVRRRLQELTVSGAAPAAQPVVAVPVLPAVPTSTYAEPYSYGQNFSTHSGQNSGAGGGYPTSPYQPSQPSNSAFGGTYASYPGSTSTTSVTPVTPASTQPSISSQIASLLQQGGKPLAPTSAAPSGGHLSATYLSGSSGGKFTLPIDLTKVRECTAFFRAATENSGLSAPIGSCGEPADDAVVIEKIPAPFPNLRVCCNQNGKENLLLQCSLAESALSQTATEILTQSVDLSREIGTALSTRRDLFSTNLLEFSLTGRDYLLLAVQVTFVL